MKHTTKKKSERYAKNYYFIHINDMIMWELFEQYVINFLWIKLRCTVYQFYNGIIQDIWEIEAKIHI